MEITLSKDCLKFLIKEFDSHSTREGNYYKSDVERKLSLTGDSGSALMSISKLNIDLLIKLADYLAEAKNDEAALFTLNGYINAVKNPNGLNIIKSIKVLIPNLVSYILHDAINGWLFQREHDGTVLPWFVKDMRFNPRYKDSPPTVSVTLEANSGKSVTSKKLIFDFKDVYGKNIKEILFNCGLIKETPELISKYNSESELYKDFINKHGIQFVTNKSLLSFDSDQRSLRRLKHGERFVNDEGRAKRVIIEEVNNSFWHQLTNSELLAAMRADEVDTTTVDMASKVKIGGGYTPFSKLPIHLRISLFNLNEHYSTSMHVSQIQPYTYMSEMQSKLVLPEDHHDLIQMLTQEVSDFNADVIVGKNNGSNILCLGKPGLGKTLTAEVYSEVCQKPLYRVHSGQLGGSAKEIETSLEKIMERALSWDAILLIDEADVFIRARDNDTNHNAIVSVFLRKMEYFSGLLFMTSNREDDIDDAILSRCVAIIKYTKPNENELTEIWKVQNKQMQAGMSADLIEELAKKFKTLSGRDVNRLLSLTKRYAENKGIPLDLDCFRKCAVFRGIV